MEKRIKSIENPEGKLGVLIVGLNGAVSTTFLAGVYSILKGLSSPIGSLTQMGTIRIGNRDDNFFPRIKEFIPLTELKDLVFGGWDIRNENCYESSLYAGVLSKEDLAKVKQELEIISPMKGVFDQFYVKRLKGDFVKEEGNKYEKMLMLREDIKRFRKENDLERIVIIWCASTEIYIPVNGVHRDIDNLISAMRNNHPDISPSMLYAYAAISEDVPFINGAPNLSCDVPALIQFSKENSVPVAGKDFKTIRKGGFLARSSNPKRRHNNTTWI